MSGYRTSFCVGILVQTRINTGPEGVGIVHRELQRQLFGRFLRLLSLLCLEGIDWFVVGIKNVAVV